MWIHGKNMDALEIKSIVEQALRDPRNFPFAVYGIIFIVAAVGAYFGAYLRRKGQNFADKEDIKQLTKIVEGVRSQYAKDLENLAHENRKVLEYFSQKHQLGLAAIDRRLEAHQQAYLEWLRLAISYHDTIKQQQSLQNCQTFYNANCLYLANRTRKAFKKFSGLQMKIWKKLFTWKVHPHSVDSGARLVQCMARLCLSR